LGVLFEFRQFYACVYLRRLYNLCCPRFTCSVQLCRNLENSSFMYNDQPSYIKPEIFCGRRAQEDIKMYTRGLWREYSG